MSVLHTAHNLLAMVIFGLFKLGNFIAHRHAASSKKTKLAAAAVGVPEKKIAPVVNLKRIQNLSPIRLGIRAKENCWVKLKADGRMLFQGILKRGRSENWEAKEKIELLLKLRAPYYAKADQTIDTSKLSIAQVVAKIISLTKTRRR